MAHAAGHDPTGMNPLSAQCFQHPLAKLPQLDAVTRHGRMLAHDSQNVALFRIGVHAQQKVRRGKVEEAERVGLNDLRQVHDAAQHFRRLRNTHGHDVIAGLARSQQVAGRADAADARHQCRHLGEWASFAKFFKATHLGHMEACLLHLSLLIQLQCDPGMAFNAGYGIDRDRRHIFPMLQNAWSCSSPACVLPAVR